MSTYIINGSDEGRFLDTIRNNVRTFASSISIESRGKHKVVIIDEADNTSNDVQLLLRAFIEEFPGKCRFIFICNYKNKIIDPIHSRCAVIDFGIQGNERQYISAKIFKRIKQILVEKDIEYDDKVLVEIIKKYFPDWRRVLNECQRYSVSGKIDTGILSTLNGIKGDELLDLIKNKKYFKTQQWVVNNLDNDPHKIIRFLYDSAYTKLEDNSIPCAVIIISKYLHWAKNCADHEINMMGCLTEIMLECEFK